LLVVSPFSEAEQMIVHDQQYVFVSYGLDESFVLDVGLVPVDENNVEEHVEVKAENHECWVLHENHDACGEKQLPQQINEDNRKCQLFTDFLDVDIVQ